MADDSGGILSDIAETVGDVAEAAAGELKKFGQSAASQISGHAGQAGGQPSKADIAKAKSATGGGSPQDQSAIDEVKGFGKSVLGQITGHTEEYGDIAKMAKADNKFSQVESEKIKAKMNQIYQEYAAKRAKERQQQEVVKKQQEEQTKKLVEQQKKEEMAVVDPAIAKTRVEIKNYGAE